MKALQIEGSRFLAVILIVLALAAKESSAAVIYNDFNGTPLSYTMGMTTVPGEVLYTINLPGLASIDLYRFTFVNTGNNHFQVYTSSGTVNFPQEWHSSLAYIPTLDAGEAWSDWAGTIAHWGSISTLNPNTGATFYLREYPSFIPFRFEDTTDNNAVKYGYIETETTVSGSGNDTLLTWTIYSYAYESNAGQELVMGGMDQMSAVVPEPSTVLMLVLGSLVLFGYRRVLIRNDD